MTYCLAIKVNEGLVFAADTRTNAGVDDIRVYNKIHTFENGVSYCIHILSAGNLATTQAILHKVRHDLNTNVYPNLSNFSHMYDVLDYVHKISEQEQNKIISRLGYSDINLSCSLIVGGQIFNEEPSISLIDKTGKFFFPNPEKQFLQIGEVDYGKPILDRFITNYMTIGDAARCALVSIDAAVRSNISVGLPVDLVIQLRDNMRVFRKERYYHDSPFYMNLQEQWKQALNNGVMNLPRFEDFYNYTNNVQNFKPGI